MKKLEIHKYNSLKYARKSFTVHPYTLQAFEYPNIFQLYNIRKVSRKELGESFAF